MPEPQPPVPGAASAVPAQLHEIAQLLRDTDHLGPEARQALAELADDLGDAFGSAAAAPAEATPLVHHLADVVEALHHERRGLLAGARRRLEGVIAPVEGRAPYGVAFARRLLDVLASLGI
jgi:hypothetical protein